jgi:hypothetical protein
MEGAGRGEGGGCMYTRRVGLWTVELWVCGWVESGRKSEWFPYQAGLVEAGSWEEETGCRNRTGRSEDGWMGPEEGSSDDCEREALSVRKVGSHYGGDYCVL